MAITNPLSTNSFYPTQGEDKIKGLMEEKSIRLYKLSYPYYAVQCSVANYISGASEERIMSCHTMVHHYTMSCSLHYLEHPFICVPSPLILR